MTSLEFRVNNLRAFRIEPNAANEAPCIIGGYEGNTVAAGVAGGVLPASRGGR